MKTSSAFPLLLLLVATLPAAEPPKPEREPRANDLRVLTPERQRRVLPRGELAEKIEKEKVAFLGVETSPASATLAAQLGLPRDTGLIVNHVVSDSPAAGVLQEHDILLRLDDQLLIETRQLAVLIRHRQAGDEVTLTYLRNGQKATAKVRLGEHEVPKLSAALAPAPGIFAFGRAPGRLEAALPMGNREEVDHVLELMQRARSGEGPVRIQVDRRAGPAVRAMSINAANSSLSFSDEAGSLEVTTKDGVKTLVARDAAGAVIFSGPVTTPKEREALPRELRERLERLESMQDFTFRTDEDFRGAETKIVRPLNRSIALPHLPVEKPRTGGSL